MHFKKFNDTYVVRVDVGEEVTASLLELCLSEGIRLAHIEAIGAASRAVFGVYDLDAQEYFREELDGFMEISSLSGTVTQKDGQPYLHLHGTAVDQQHRVHGGHVLELVVGATCEMIVRALPGEIERVKDEVLGINLMKL